MRKIVILMCVICPLMPLSAVAMDENCNIDIMAGVGAQAQYAQVDVMCGFEAGSDTRVSIAPRAYYAKHHHDAAGDNYQTSVSFAEFAGERDVGEVTIKVGLMNIEQVIETDLSCTDPLGCARHLDRPLEVLEDGRNVAVPGMSVTAPLKDDELEFFLVAAAKPYVARDDKVAPVLPQGVRYGRPDYPSTFGTGLRYTAEEEWGTTSITAYNGPTSAPTTLELRGREVVAVGDEESTIHLAAEIPVGDYTARIHLANRHIDDTQIQSRGGEMEYIFDNGEGDTSTFVEVGYVDVDGECDSVVYVQCAYKGGVAQARIEHTIYSDHDITVGGTMMEMSDSHYRDAFVTIGDDDGASLQMKYFVADGDDDTFFGAYADEGVRVTYTKSL